MSGKSRRDALTSRTFCATVKNTVATMDNNTIYVYNKDGELRGTCFAGSGARRLILCSDNEAYVLSVTQIRKIDLANAGSTADSAAG